MLQLLKPTQYLKKITFQLQVHIQGKGAMPNIHCDPLGGCNDCTMLMPRSVLNNGAASRTVMGLHSKVAFLPL